MQSLKKIHAWAQMQVPLYDKQLRRISKECVVVLSEEI